MASCQHILTRLLRLRFDVKSWPQILNEGLSKFQVSPFYTPAMYFLLPTHSTEIQKTDALKIKFTSSALKQMRSQD